MQLAQEIFDVPALIIGRVVVATALIFTIGYIGYAMVKAVLDWRAGRAARIEREAAK